MLAVVLMKRKAMQDNPYLDIVPVILVETFTMEQAIKLQNERLDAVIGCPESRS